MHKQNILCKRVPGIFLVLVFLVFLAGMAVVYSQSTPAIGDVNDDDTIDIIDALLIAQYYVGLNPPIFFPSLADVNESGMIDIVDALNVAQYSVGLITTLPPGTQPTPTPAGTLLDNPFEGASWYIDPEWSAQAMAGGGGKIADCNTAIILEYAGSITDGIGLRGHLDNAREQNSNLILIGLYCLPRECGFYWQDPLFNYFNWYVNEIIDPVASILSDPLYRDIRKVILIEPETLVNLITNLDIAACAEMNGPGGYIDMIRYAINQLRAIPHTYLYVDIAFSGWLGWYDNFSPAADLMTSVIKGTTNGLDSISGFICNTLNYSPLEEPYLPDPYLEVNGKAIRSSIFYEWNMYLAELKYTQDMYAAFVERGFPPSIGMLINTSRNGWGGLDRPAGVSSSTDLDTYVNESRIDRRLHRGNWCNQPGGIGERPRANPAPNIDAYVWSWPPGLSDGISAPGVDPDNPNNTFKVMCDPEGQSIYYKQVGTGALPGAPHRGRWNQDHFELLLRNAYPPLN
ncbi:MAG: glycoside hydrolase family 6 protein [Spirochaetales bacterium]|nr:glycoside hydrolase family 6 protein [Spirochaetales bacterium]